MTPLSEIRSKTRINCLQISSEAAKPQSHPISSYTFTRVLLFQQFILLLPLLSLRRHISNPEISDDMSLIVSIPVTHVCVLILSFHFLWVQPASSSQWNPLLPDIQGTNQWNNLNNFWINRTISFIGKSGTINSSIFFTIQPLEMTYTIPCIVYFFQKLPLISSFLSDYDHIRTKKKHLPQHSFRHKYTNYVGALLVGVCILILSQWSFPIPLSGGWVSINSRVPILYTVFLFLESLKLLIYTKQL